ncbi:LOW QUALITY PROTEIN: hypothetical protein PHMEG_00012406 [Phytophthora megakarya]|uniref:Uncharacterized protein n=1 Tax=Phytophthora megakarya TaxID=4795 RepID=A0A225W8T8_9STRA|nr:LOW QUALITY PROTEIN: hypothetical protein PHMEG_00012406 [Phytophthora megakarya]
MLGDVVGAFRHIPVYAGAVLMFGFRYKDLLVIDLSCGFGWCGSPAYYAVEGELINYFYEFDSRATRFKRAEIHTVGNKDQGARLVVGHGSRMASIPPGKMSKAFDRVQNLISTSSTSKTELLQGAFGMWLPVLGLRVEFPKPTIGIKLRTAF